MKHCVQAQLKFDTKAKRDNLMLEVKDKFGLKKTWGEKVFASGVDEDGKPSNNIVIRFDVKANMDDLFAFLVEKMKLIPVLKGTVTKHNCGHDQTPHWDCLKDPRAEYEEFKI